MVKTVMESSTIQHRNQPHNQIQKMSRELLTRRVLSKAQLSKAIKQSQGNCQLLLRWLLDQPQLDKLLIAEVIAQEYQLPVVDLQAIRLPEHPERIAALSLIRKLRVLPIKAHGNSLTIVVSSPCQESVLQELRFHTGRTIKLVITAHDQLNTALDRMVRQQDFSAIGQQSTQVSHAQQQLTNDQEFNPDDDRPIVGLVNKLLNDAVLSGASDIHLEPFEKQCRIRFRNDGVLHKVGEIPAHAANRIAARVKVMARMDVAERRLPQDGRLRLQYKQKEVVEFRVSSVPTIWGEKLVLRLLQIDHSTLELNRLGLEPVQRQHLLTALQKSQGMILVTGPTGSGKSSTLYAALKHLNDDLRNIATAEDPVELPMPGINQVQVNTQQGLNFSTAMRAFLRQDPDVLMVGEIRDQETAEIAVKAAQTGHLVLSTLHTNSAIESLARLQSMGVKSFNLASSVNLVIAQRLLRKLCPHCKQAAVFTNKELAQEGIAMPDGKRATLYQACGCHECHAGYKGRIGIYEVVPISPTLSRHIMAEQELTTTFEQAVGALGTTTLRQSALLKVSAGLTSLEEANRLT